MDSDDLGLFGPGSVTWKVHREPILMIAGLRALYLQALHPRAIAGVEQNSNYRQDPFGRLERTASYVTTTTWGTTAEAETLGQRVRHIHSQLTAVDPFTGERFPIDEPELLRWIHVTEVESFLSTARRAGLTLTDDEVDRYYTEQHRSAALVGLAPETVPGTAAEVEAYYREVRGELRLTRDSASTALFLTAPPIPWKVSLPVRLGLTLGPPRWAYLGFAATAIGLLPAWARRLYGGLGLPTTALTAEVSVRALRLVLQTLPARWRMSPAQQAAWQRVERMGKPVPDHRSGAVPLPRPQSIRSRAA